MTWTIVRKPESPDWPATIESASVHLDYCFRGGGDGGWLAGWLAASLAAVAIESAHKLVKLPDFLTMQV